MEFRISYFPLNNVCVTYVFYIQLYRKFSFTKLIIRNGDNKGSTYIVCFLIFTFFVIYHAVHVQCNSYNALL